MKRSAREGALQLGLQFDSSESEIWETLNARLQQQVVEHLARLWMQHVITIQDSIAGQNARLVSNNTGIAQENS